MAYPVCLLGTPSQQRQLASEQQAVARLQSRLQLHRELRVTVCANFVARVARQRQSAVLHRCFLAWRCAALAGRPRLPRLAGAAAPGSGRRTTDLQDLLRLPSPGAAAMATGAQRLAASSGGLAGAQLRSPLATEEPRAVLAVRPSPARPLPAPAAAGRASQQRPSSTRAWLASQLSGQAGNAGGPADATSGTNSGGSSSWTTASSETAALLPQAGNTADATLQIAQVKASLLAALAASSAEDHPSDAGPQQPSTRAQASDATGANAALAAAERPLPRAAKAGPGAGRRSAGGSAPAWRPGGRHSSAQPPAELPAGGGDGQGGWLA